VTAAGVNAEESETNVSNRRLSDTRRGIIRTRIIEKENPYEIRSERRKERKRIRHDERERERERET
jgi:hypothetical protein